MSLVCDQCDKSFTQFKNLKRHKSNVHSAPSFTCDDCDVIYSRKDVLLRHTKICKNKEKHTCSICHQQFRALTQLRIHKITSHTPTCNTCNTSFKSQYELKKHNFTTHTVTFNCHKCGRAFAENECRLKHEKKCGKFSRVLCDICGKTIMAFRLEKHMLDHKKAPSSKLKLKMTDLYRTLVYEPGSFHTDFPLFLDSMLEILVRDLDEEVNSNPCKWYLAVKITFEKNVGEVEEIESWIRTKVYVSLQSNNTTDQMKLAFSDLIQAFSEFTKDGSGWSIKKLEELNMNIFKYEPLAGSSFIPLPEELEKKKAIINIQNDHDEKCFLWSVLAGVHDEITENRHRVCNYKPYENELNLDNITFPFKVSQTEKFERMNQLSINVFGYENEHFFPIHISSFNFDRVIDLLLISNGETQHYCLIPNINRLFSSLTKHNGAAFYCRYCLHRFVEERTLNAHKPTCSEFGPQSTRMPPEDNKTVMFTNQHFQLKIPFYIVADFECIAKPTKQTTNGKIPTDSYTVKINKHIPCGFCYYVVGPTIDYCKEPVIYRGRDASKVLLEMLSQEEEEIMAKYKNPVPMRLSASDDLEFREAMSHL